MKVAATITAIDSPSEGWYTARTVFGTIVTGVSLRAVPLALAQSVAVFEVDGEFGAFDTYGDARSILTIPTAHRADIYSKNPAGATLGYIATLAENRIEYYTTGAVTDIVDDLLVVDGKTYKTDGVSASDFLVGDGVLIRTYGGNAVIGWWQTVSSIAGGIEAVKIARIPLSASVYMRLVNSAGKVQTTVNSVTLFPDPGEFVDSAFVTTLKTDDTEEYFYSYVYMFRNFGGAYQEHYVRWHKTNFTVEEISFGAYTIAQANQPVDTKTANDKFWFWNYPTPPAGTTDAEYCYIADTLIGDKSRAFYSGKEVLSGLGAWWPKKGYDYEGIA